MRTVSKWSVSKWILALGAAAAVTAGASPLWAQQTIRVGWTIPAEESKYWMMRRPAEFPNLGKTYNIEWTQFQGTAPMTQALAAGALDCATQAPLSLANGVVGGNLKAYIVAQHVFENKSCCNAGFLAVSDVRLNKLRSVSLIALKS